MSTLLQEPGKDKNSLSSIILIFWFCFVLISLQERHHYSKSLMFVAALLLGLQPASPLGGAKNHRLDL